MPLPTELPQLLKVKGKSNTVYMYLEVLENAVQLGFDQFKELTVQF